MGKKIIFLGSIVSFVILLVVSFTSVVGYQTVTSSLKDSPLFTVRTKRAINEEPESIFIYNYFKTFKPLIIPFPMRDDTFFRIKEVAETLRTMSDKEFERLLLFIDLHSIEIDEINEKNKKDIISTLNILRNTNSMQLVNAIARDDQSNGICTPSLAVFFLCLLFATFINILQNIVSILLAIFGLDRSQFQEL